MKIKYGSHSHDSNECEIQISKQANLNSAGVPYSVTHRWTINGMLVPPIGSDDPSGDLTAIITGLESAYDVQNRDIGLYFDDGTPTAHILRNTQTIGGVRIIQPPSFPEGKGAEYANRRNYTLVVEAEVQAEGDVTVINFQESLEFTGGGPRFIFLQTLNGPPQKQRVANYTTYHCVQSGQAVGYLDYPLVPQPLFPGDEHTDNRRIVKNSPVKRGIGRTYVEYPVQWSFVFESNVPFYGEPNFYTV